MTIEELFESLNVKDTIAQAKYEAFEKVLENAKRLHESCDRKIRELNIIQEKGFSSKDAADKHQQKLLVLYAQDTAYIKSCEILMKAMNSLQEEHGKELHEIHEQILALKEKEGK